MIAFAAEQLYDNCQAEAFDLELHYLRSLSKHPSDISATDRQNWCAKTKFLADDIERSRVVQNRKLGNDPGADRWQQKSYGKPAA